MKKKQQKLPILFILLGTIPTVLLLILFIVYPTIQSGLLSFQNVGLLSAKGDFVGLENYAYMLKDEKLMQALWNTIKLMLAIPIITLLISFLLAVALHRTKLREKNIYITVCFFPYFLSAPVVSVVWSFVFHPTSGILNKGLSDIGLGVLARTWLGDSQTALWCIATVIIWACIGYYVVLYLSGLDSISEELYESATIDGANAWQQMIFITVPLMKNIIGTTFILLMSGVLQVTFVYSKLLTNGGPNGASNVVLRYIYTQGMEKGNVGYSSAISILSMAIAIALSVVARALTNKSEKE